MIFYMAFNKHRFRKNIQYYWLDLFHQHVPANATKAPFTINYVLIVEEDAPPLSAIIEEFFLNYLSFLNVTTVRVPTAPNSEYKRLVCKMTAGMRKIYELFPDKRFYMKIDDDTVIFPHRLLKLLRTTYLIYRVEEEPIFIGENSPFKDIL